MGGIIGRILGVIGVVLTSGTFCYAMEVMAFPEVGPIVRDITEERVVIMGQGKRGQDVQGVYRFTKILDRDRLDNFSTPHTFSMDQADRNVGHALLDNLEPGTAYQIQIGYAPSHDDLSQVNWDQAHKVNIATQGTEKSDTFSFLAGSCRRLGKVMGIALWDDKGDQIYEAMVKDAQITQASGGKTNLIAFIGDQIYADATDPLGNCSTFKEYAKRYELAFSQHFIRKLMASGIPIYMMRDDHEWWNDANKEAQEARPDQNVAAKKAYDLFQRPLAKITPKWWYSISGDIDIFFTDTRSEREPSKNLIMSPEQMEALKGWLVRKDLKDRIKVIVSSVPMLLLDTEDSWGGYKEQLAELLTHIATNHIQHIMVLSGDAHCQNDALFTIYNDEGKAQAQILEVLVSGLFAVSRRKADLLSDHMDLRKYGYYAKAEKGIKPTLKENLFGRIAGNHKEKTVDVWIYDHENNLLKEAHYDLQGKGLPKKKGVKTRKFNQLKIID